MKRALAAAVALVFFVENGPLLYAAENSFWVERHARNQRPAEPTQLAALPAGAAPAQLLERLPSVSAASAIAPREAAAPIVPTSMEKIAAAIPLTHGSIKKTDLVDGALGTVVILQDIHLNPEAQDNIAAILASLASSGQAGLVGVEGAFADFDFAPFRDGDPSIRKTLAADFLKKNLIAAPSFVGLTAEGAVPPFTGVDDPAGYKANVDAYLASRVALGDVAADLSHAKAALAALKRDAFSRELQSFDGVAGGYHDGTVELGAYVDRLASVEPALPRDLRRFSEARALEKKLDFPRVERERALVVRRLAETLSEPELKDLLARGLAQRTGQIGFAEFYDGIRALCERKKISLAAAPAFDAYLSYVRLADGIDGEALFADLATVEDGLYARLAPTPEAAAIATVDRRVRLFTRLAGFSFTSDEWKRFDESRGGWDAAVAALPLPDADRAKIAALAGRLAPFEAFYKEADIRSKTIVDRLLARPLANPAAARVLVLGGFHAPMVAALLRERKMSTITVQPKVTAVASGTGTEYLSVFERDNTPLDRLFKGPKLTVAPDVVALGTPGVRTAPVSSLLRILLALENALDLGRALPAALGIRTTKNADGTVSFTAPTVGGTVSGRHGATAGDLGHVSGLTFAPGSAAPVATMGLTRWFTLRVLNRFFKAGIAESEIPVRVAPKFETALTGAVFAAVLTPLLLVGMPGLAAAGIAFLLANAVFALLHLGSLRTAQGPPASKAAALGRLFVAGLGFHAPLLLAGPALLLTSPVIVAGVLAVIATTAFGWGSGAHLFYNDAVLRDRGSNWPVASAGIAPTVRDPRTGEFAVDTEVYRGYPILSLTNPTTRFLGWLAGTKQLLVDIGQRRLDFKRAMDGMRFKDKDSRAARDEKTGKLRAYARQLVDDFVAERERQKDDGRDKTKDAKKGLALLSAGQTTTLVNSLRDAELFELAAAVFEETPAARFRQADINGETYLWNLVRLSEQQIDLPARMRTITKASDFSATYMANKPAAETLSGDFLGRMAVVFRKKHEVAEALRVARNAKADAAVLNPLIAAYRTLFPSDPTLESVDDNSVMNLLLAHGNFMRGFRVDYGSFPGINSMSTAVSLDELAQDTSLDSYARQFLLETDPADATKKISPWAEQVRQLSPLVYQSLRTSGGEQSNSYWVLASLAEYAASEGLGPRFNRFYRLALGLSTKAQDVASTLGRLEIILARRQRSPGAANDETTRGLAQAVVDFRARLEVLRAGGDDNRPAAETAVVADNPRLNTLLGATRKMLSKMFDFRGIDQDFVGGNVEYDGQTHSTSVGRPDVRLATQILKGMNLYGSTDFETFDRESNKFISHMLNLVDPRTMERWMEDLHSDRHKVFDAVVKALREYSEARTTKLSQTNVTADLAMSLGDCRQAAHVKQLLYDTWKKANVNLAMDQSWGLLHKADVTESQFGRLFSRMQRLRLESARLGDALKKFESGTPLDLAKDEPLWKDVSQRMVDRVERNDFADAATPNRLKELVYLMESGATLSPADNADIAAFITEEMASLSRINGAYGRLVGELGGRTSGLTADELKILQQDTVRQINLIMNWQLAVLDIQVFGNISMKEKYQENTAPAGAVDENGRSIAGQALASNKLELIEDHTMNGLYRLRKTYVREQGTGRLVQVKIMDRFTYRDSFYNDVYQWRDMDVTDLTKTNGDLLKDIDDVSKSQPTAPAMAAGQRKGGAYVYDRTEGGVAIYKPVAADITLRFTKHAGQQQKRMGAQSDENGLQFRIWGLLSEEVTFASLISTDRRARVWKALRWIRDIVDIQKATPAPGTPEDGIVQDARAGMARLGTMVAEGRADRDIDAEVARLQALAADLRARGGQADTPVDDLIAPYEAPARAATWPLTFFLARTGVGLLNRLGFNLPMLTNAQVSLRVAPWFETGVTALAFGAAFAALALGWIPGVSHLPSLLAGGIAFLASNLLFTLLHFVGGRTAQGPPATLPALVRLFSAGAAFHAPILLAGLAVAVISPAAGLAAGAAVIGLALIAGTALHTAYNAAVQPSAAEPGDGAAAPSAAATAALPASVFTGAVPTALRALGLADAQVVDGPRDVTAQFFDASSLSMQPFALQVVTITPAHGGSDLLRAEAGRDVGQFDVVLRNGRILAVVPNLTDEEMASPDLAARRLRYFDFIGLSNAPLAPGAPGAAAAWRQALNEQERDRRALTGYFRTLDFSQNPAAATATNGLLSPVEIAKPAQVFVRIDLKDGNMRATEITDGTLAALAAAPASTDPDVIETVLNVLPTVYSPGEKSNFNDDRDYYSSILRAPRDLERLTGGRWEGKKRILLVGAGSGLDTLTILIAALRTAGENARGRGYTLEELRAALRDTGRVPSWAPDITARDINPMAVANTRELFERLGIGAVLNVQAGVNLPERPASPFDMVIWNMPVYPAGEVTETSLAGKPLTSFHDGGLNGKIALEELAKRLPFNLAPGGLSVLWNYGRLDAQNNDVVVKAIESDPQAQRRGLKVSGGYTVGPVTYYVTAGRADESGRGGTSLGARARAVVAAVRAAISRVGGLAAAAADAVRRRVTGRSTPRADAERTARRLVSLFQNGQMTAGQVADAVLGLVSVEKITERPATGATTASALNDALSAALATLRADGMSPDAAARVADLVFQLQANAAAPAAGAARIQPLAEVRSEANEPLLFASWISSPGMGAGLIRETLLKPADGGPARFLALGVKDEDLAKTRDALRALLGAQVFDGLVSAGRLALIGGDQRTNVLAFVQKAKGLREVAALGKPQIRLLLNEGAVLPPDFLNLTPDEWTLLRNTIIVDFITRSLQAIPMDANVVRDYQAFRLIMTQA